MFVGVGKDQIHINKLLDSLFRHEYGKLVSVLTRLFGPENLELAEDVVQDSLIAAIKNWPYKGIPADPSAWLYQVAKNKALNMLNQDKFKRKYSSDVAHHLQSSWTAGPALDYLFSEHEIKDDQLRMIFTSCHPSLSKDSQVALTLKTLCGFSIAEIAHAFFTTEDTINKRLVRSRKKIREANLRFEIPGKEEIQKRLDAVLETIYLVFNEGYSASTGDEVIRFEFCEEAIRLAELLAGSPAIENKSNVYASLALMFLNASRFSARLDREGNILTLAEQDRHLWNRELMQQGFAFLEKSTVSNVVSVYHILATISAYHCSAPDFESTDWGGILALYDYLLTLDPSSLVRLNRSIAVAKIKGPSNALDELKVVKADPSFTSYHLLYSTEATFYLELGDFENAADSLRKAIEYAALKAEKDLLGRKLQRCLEKIS
jgi:RNA polymerase sigma factor (sigma-70 family)